MSLCSAAPILVENKVNKIPRGSHWLQLSLLCTYILEMQRKKSNIVSLRVFSCLSEFFGSTILQNKNFSKFLSKDLSKIMTMIMNQTSNRTQQQRTFLYPFLYVWDFSTNLCSCRCTALLKYGCTNFKSSPQPTQFNC